MVRRDFQPGERVHERFVLEMQLHGGSAVSIWRAHDTFLQARVLLQLHPLAGSADAETLDSIKRGPRQAREVQHPGSVRVHDVHVAEGLALVSIDDHPGAVLESILPTRGAGAYRDVIALLRPIIEALLQLHEGGAQHGQLDLVHVIVADDGAAALLPANGTTPVRNDMRQLGRLFAALLTGGRAPEDHEDLNDLADRLHQGRTIPALLNQLVSDLRHADRARRPASMGDVLHRLDQLEEYVAPAAAPAAASTVPAPAAPAPAPRPTVVAPSRGLGARLAWILVPVALLAITVLVITQLERASPTAQLPDDTPAATTEPGTEDGAAPSESIAGQSDPDAPAAPEIDPAEVAAAKQAADGALSAYLDVRREADGVGAGAWNLPAYDDAATAAATADEDYRAESFADAQRGYETATAHLRVVLEATDETFARLMAEGQAALDAPDAARATASFDAALLIEPGDEPARIGRQRAATLDELHRLLQSATAHENENRLEFAYADFVAAAELDPHSTHAAESASRVRAAIAEQAFRSRMSAALDAFHEERLDEARGHIIEALGLRADSEEALEALSMIDEARLRVEVGRLQEVARDHEAVEQWQAARLTYRQVLAIDPAIEFAQDGVARAERMIRLLRFAHHFTDNPELLQKAEGRSLAEELVAEIGAVPDRGPRLDAAYRDLAQETRRATTPRRVVLRSDAKTNVDVYRVGRYGTFRTFELTLLPGRYTVVGYRRGYKDVRITLEVKPTDDVVTLEVICRESI